MRRRDFVIRLSSGLALGPLVLKLQACTVGEGGEPPPGSGGGDGTGTGGSDGGELAQFRVANMDSSGHSHWFWIECSAAAAGVGATYTAEGSHTHQVVVSGADLDRVFNGEQVSLTTTDGHPHTWVIQMPSAACTGDPGDTGGEDPPDDPPDDPPPDPGGW